MTDSQTALSHEGAVFLLANPWWTHTDNFKMEVRFKDTPIGID